MPPRCTPATPAASPPWRPAGAPSAAFGKRRRFRLQTWPWNRGPDMRSYRYLNFITAVFVTVLVVSNIASSAKIIDWGVSLLGVRLAFDGGTLLFPISYIFGDILTEVYGYRRSRGVIWTGFFCLALSAGVFWLVQILPGEADWQQRVGQAQYLNILGGMSSG